MAEELTPEEQILQNALAPKKATGDSGSAEQHPIADQIAAMNLARAARARRRTSLPIRLFKISPQGGADE